jgi:hypothetical protein
MRDHATADDLTRDAEPGRIEVRTALRDPSRSTEFSGLLAAVSASDPD